VDIDIPFQTGSFASSVVHLLGIVAVMSQVAWQVFIVFIPITAINIWYQVFLFCTMLSLMTGYKDVSGSFAKFIYHALS